MASHPKQGNFDIRCPKNFKSNLKKIAFEFTAMVKNIH